MKIKKLLVLVLSVVLLLGCLTITVFADSDGPTELTDDYKTWVDGDNLIVSEDLKIEDFVTVSGAVTLTINDGCTLTVDCSAKTVSKVINGTFCISGHLTVNGTGTLKCVGPKGSAAMNCGGTGIVINDDAKLIINGSTIIANGGTGSLEDDSVGTGILQTGDVVINSGVLQVNYIYNYCGTITINGGVVETSAVYLISDSIGTGLPVIVATIEINGGSLKFLESDYIDDYGNRYFLKGNANDFKTNITGGLFNVDVSSYLLDDYVCIANHDDNTQTDYPYKVVCTWDYLDLETSDTYSDKKEYEQNYTFTQTSEEYTDVTKVKLEWKITDIAATYKSNKTWDPDTLTWKETKTVDDIAEQTVEFTLTNYSSVKIIGTVEFKPEDSLKDTLSSATFDDNNGNIIDTVVKTDYSVDDEKKESVPSNVITATLKFNKDKFVDLSQTSSLAKYGTYTITIIEGPKLITFNELTDEKEFYAAYDVVIEVIENSIILDGDSWEEVIENNKNNKIKIRINGEGTEDFELVIGKYTYEEIDYISLIDSEGEPFVLLFANDLDVDDVSTDNSLKSDDPLCKKLYFSLFGE